MGYNKLKAGDVVVVTNSEQDWLFEATQYNAFGVLGVVEQKDGPYDPDVVLVTHGFNDSIDYQFFVKYHEDCITKIGEL
tara:strand:- start:1160 stop:1396 length:237 start_codon:yes stop_codon:yes gene_type:complete